VHCIHRYQEGKGRVGSSVERWVDRMEHQGVPTAAETSTVKVAIATKLEVQKICTFSMVLKTKSESDLLVRKHWAGRNLSGGVGNREEKHKTKGNEKGNTQDLVRKQGHPSQLRALLGAEDCV